MDNRVVDRNLYRFSYRYGLQQPTVVYFLILATANGKHRSWRRLRLCYRIDCLLNRQVPISRRFIFLLWLFKSEKHGYVILTWLRCWVTIPRARRVRSVNNQHSWLAVSCCLTANFTVMAVTLNKKQTNPSRRSEHLLRAQIGRVCLTDKVASITWRAGESFYLFV